MTKYCILWTLICVLFSTTGCNNKSRKTASTGEENTPTIKPVVTFNADSAFSFIQKQVEMGPRVPGSEASRECAAWITERLKKSGADTVITQSFTATAHNGDKLPLVNIMGRYGTRGQPRLLLLAHYDTRPWADREHDPDDIMTPIPGANDGASGVAALIEMARLFAQKRPEMAIDLLFVDGEDYGKSEGWQNTDSTWCLGTQYWINHMPHDYRTMTPRYGILLDMVGGKHAQFLREFISDRYAPTVLDKVWQIAQASGYGDLFINKPGGSVIDDHLFTNSAGIPTIDIIDCNNEETGNFPRSWHTLNDNIDNIDPEVLQAVGQTVANVIYRERP